MTCRDLSSRSLLGLVLLLVLLHGAGPVLGAASDDFDDAVIVATNSAFLEQNSQVVDGDVVVNDASPGPTLASQKELTIGLGVTTPAGFAVKADSIRVRSSAVVGGDVFCNELDDGSGAVTCTALPLPVFAALPPFVAAEPRPDAADVHVASGGSAVLAPGDYGDVTVKQNGSLLFTGGIYNLRSLDAGIAVNLVFAAPSEVRIAGRFDTDQSSYVGPQPGAAVTAADVVFYVAGINGAGGNLGATPKAAQIGLGNSVEANFYVPNGTLWLRQGSVATGSFIGRDVDVGIGVTVTLDSFFANRPPSAAPQDVFTNGAGAVEITLTGSDPDGDDLTFTIAGPPSQGTLGAVTQDPPPFPGDPPGCNPDNDPLCLPPDPPRTSARVTYTPDTAGDEEDGFIFQVADPDGAFGMAVVRINPPDAPEGPSPDPIDTVVAFDAAAETAVELAVTIVLLGGAPCDGDCDGIGEDVPLTFSIAAGPAHGTLEDLTQGAETPRRTASVTYAPADDFEGDDAFDFTACGLIDAVEVCDAATVTVAVFGELAQDQSVTTFENKPVTITLTGTAGAGSKSLVVRGKAAFIDGAEIAGNVADAGGDGFGDNHNDLPGSSPVLMSAAVDAAGGAGSNGVVRMQIEWDVSGLAGLAGDLVTADVILHTVVGSVDSLDTFFFAGTAEQDALLTDSDFEAPAAAIPGVVMPVPPGAEAGDEGTFTFDVKPQLLAALTGDRSFFSIQGRVDEGLAGGGFQRGLQVRTTAAGNLASFLEPQLALTTPGVTPPALTFTILTLPAHGTLRDALGSPITAVPAILTSPDVTYTPDLGFTGTDQFTFEVQDLGLNVDVGLVSIFVDALLIDPCVANGRPPGCQPGQ